MSKVWTIALPIIVTIVLTIVASYPSGRVEVLEHKVRALDASDAKQDEKLEAINALKISLARM